MNAFLPYCGKTYATGAASAAFLLPVPVGAQPGASRGTHLYVTNMGSFPIFMALGDASVVATVDNYPVFIGFPGTIVEIGAGDPFAPPYNTSVGPAYIAFISPGGVGSVNVQCGKAT